MKRPDGHDIFAGMTLEQQNDALGDHAAELIRSGHASLSDLIATSHMAAIDDQITQAPIRALT